MLNSFRKLASSLPAKILLIVLVISFGVWGIGDMLRTQSRNASVATVGSATISANEFAHALRRDTENLRRIMGNRYSPEFAQSLNLPSQVLRRLVSHMLLTLESQSLGLMPSDTEVARRIRSNTALQDSKGNFDKSAFEAALRNAGVTEKAYVEQLRQDMASELLTGTLTSAAPVSEAAVRAMYDIQEGQRTVSLYPIPLSLVANAPAPTETQVKEFYDAHKNDFTAPEYRTLSYVTIAPADAQAVTVSEDDLKAAYKERIDEFKHAERRTVEQLLYSSEEKAKAAEALLKSGKSFADVAKQMDILNKDAVSLGKVERSAVLQNAADAIFSLPTGGHTAPIQSSFGWHIFRVSAITPPSILPLEEVRPMLERDLKQHAAGEAQTRLAGKLQDALAGGATLKEAANELKLKLHNVGPTDHQGMAPDNSKVKDLPELDKFLDTAFKTDDKTESSLIAARDGVDYILRVDSITPERARALDEVRARVIAGWQKEERQKNLDQLARDIALAFADPAKRAAAVAKYDLKPVTGTLKRNSTALDKLALPPGLIDDVFRRKPEESTQSYGGGNGNYLIAVVTAVLAAPEPDKDPKLQGTLADIRNNLMENAQNEILEQYVHYLTEKYGVSINNDALLAVSK